MIRGHDLENERFHHNVLVLRRSGSLCAVCPARRAVNRIETKVILIAGAQLAELMIDYGVGVTTEATYELKRIDADYFADE